MIKLLPPFHQYSLARENQDTVLLKKILTEDIDQLVSSGEWRSGLDEAIAGMMASSTTNHGSRKLTVERIKFMDSNVAVVDARYEIIDEEIVTRKMWSTFVVHRVEKVWKIASIRNMLPAK
ncbi:DUF4440 domain-containing protein [Algoriphagus namhaensis]